MRFDCGESHDDGGKQCHRRPDHRGPHHADPDLVWDRYGRDISTRARHYSDCPGRRRLTAVMALFLPGTPPPRLVLLAVMLLLPTAFPGPGWIKDILGLLVILTLITALIFAFMRIAYWGDRDEPGRWGAFFNLLSVGIVIAAFYALPYAIEGLTVLTSAGQDLAPTSAEGNWGLVTWTGMVLLLAIPWLLIGVPNQAFILKVDNNGKGDAQRVLVGVIRRMACILTAVYLVVLHFNGGPLSELKGGSLFVGIVATLVLVAPFYKWLATAFWRRGLSGAITYEALQQYLGNAHSEVRDAFDRSEPPRANTFKGRIRTDVLGYKGIGSYWFDGLSELPRWLKEEPHESKTAGPGS